MIAIYLVVEKAQAAPEFVDAYLSGSAEKVATVLAPLVSEAFGSGLRPPGFEVGELLSNALLEPSLVNKANEAIRWADSDGPPDATAFLYVPITLDPASAKVDSDSLENFNELVLGGCGVGADIGLQPAYLEAPQWSRRHGPGGGCGTRSEALRAIGADFLATKDLTGAGVNVVIVDQGLDRGRLPENYLGGWKVDAHLPGALKYVRGVTQNDHGMMVARNILAVAPAARVLDCPLIPDRIQHVTAFLAKADIVLNWVRLWINFLRALGLVSGPWIVVNAWAIFDRSTEHPRGHYAENGAHPFNEQIRRFADDGIDVVFAAGNCGGFGPDSRCGLYDVGPGRSIFGAHAHRRALTVGAMRTDGLWDGSSSQGRGPVDVSSTANLIREKPDLCAPSHFSDPYDAHAFNGGTSTACAVAAGAIAALRDPASGLGNPSSAIMFDALRQGAVRAGAPRWDGRLGFGMLDLKRTFDELKANASHQRNRRRRT